MAPVAPVAAAVAAAPPIAAPGGLLDLDLDFTAPPQPPAAVETPAAPLGAVAPVAPAPVQQPPTGARYSAFDDLCEPPQGPHGPHGPMSAVPAVPGVPGVPMAMPANPQMPAGMMGGPMGGLQLPSPARLQQMAPEQLMQWQMMLQSQMQMVMQLLQSKQSQMPQAAPQAEGPGQFNDLVNAFQHRAGAVNAPHAGHAPAPCAAQAPAAAESGNPFDMF